MSITSNNVHGREGTKNVSWADGPNAQPRVEVELSSTSHATLAVQKIQIGSPHGSICPPGRRDLVGSFRLGLGRDATTSRIEASATGSDLKAAVETLDLVQTVKVSATTEIELFSSMERVDKAWEVTFLAFSDGVLGGSLPLLMASGSTLALADPVVNDECQPQVAVLEITPRVGQPEIWNIETSTAFRRGVTPNALPLSGSFQLRWNGRATTSLPHNATAEEVQSRLEPAIFGEGLDEGSSLITVARTALDQLGASLYRWTVAILQTDGFTNKLVADGSGLVGEGSISANLATCASLGGRFHLPERWIREPVRFPHPQMEGNSSKAFIVQGTIAAVARVVRQVQYRSTLEWDGLSNINIAMRHTGLAALESDTVVGGHVQVRIVDVDDLPTVTWNGAMLVEHDEIIFDGDATLQRGFEVKMANGTGLHVEDVDTSFDDMEVLLACEHNEICCREGLPRVDVYGGDTTVEGEDSEQLFQCGSELSLRGAFSDVNTALSTLTYKPTASWWGIDELEVRAGNKLGLAKATLPLRVNPINHSPLIHLKGVVEDKTNIAHTWENLTLTAEDTVLHIDEIPVSDPDYTDSLCSLMGENHCVLVVQIQAENGVLSVAHTDDIFPMALDGHQSHSLLLKGTSAALNNALSTLTYTGDPHFNGCDELVIKVEDLGSFAGLERRPLSFARQIQILISSANDPPTIVLPQLESGYLTALEDVALIIGNDCDDGRNGRGHGHSLIGCTSSIVIHDADFESGDGSFDSIAVTLLSKNGKVSLPQAPHEDLDSETSLDGTYSANTTLSGTLGAVNMALQTVVYLPDQNFNSEAGELGELTIAATDAHGASSSSTLVIYVAPINDDPVITFDGEHVDQATRNGDEMGYKRISCETLVILEDEAARLEGISVRDVDFTQPGFIELSLKAIKGELMVEEGVPVQTWMAGASGAYTKSLKFQTSLSTANAALRGLWYMPHHHHSGSDTVTISVSDLGHSGRPAAVFRHHLDFPITEDHAVGETPLTDTLSIPISVIEVEDSPSISIPASLDVTEDVPKILEPSSVQILHPDSNETEVSVAIRCNHGMLCLSLHEGLTLTEKSKGQDEEAPDNWLLFGTGTVENFNLAFSEIAYVPDMNWNTLAKAPDEVHFTVSNVGSTLPPVSKVIYVEVDAVNDSPEVLVPDMNMVLQRTGGYKLESVERMYVDEDSELVLSSSVSVVDVDVTDRQEEFLLTMSLTASEGTIQLFTTEGLSFLSGKDQSCCMKWRGAFSNSNAALSRIVYRGASNFYGDDVLDIFVSDEGNEGSGGALDSRVGIPITIFPVQDIPTLLTPDFALFCGEEGWCVVPDILLEDPDASTSSIFVVQISVGIGRVSFSKSEFPPSVTISDERGTDYKGSFQLSGPVDDVNFVLKHLVYLGSAGSNGSIDMIHLLAWVEGADEWRTDLTAVGHVYVVLTNTDNNAPIIDYEGATYRSDRGCDVNGHSSDYREELSHSYPVARENVNCRRLVDVDFLSCLEDVDCKINGIQVDDPDSEVLELCLKVTNGTLLLNNATLTGIYFVGGHSEGQRTITVQGTVVQINDALKGLFFWSDFNFFGTDQLEL